MFAHARPLRLLFTVVASFLGTQAAVASAATPLPPQGLYMESAPSAQGQTAAELSQLGHAGFRLALNYEAWYGTPDDIRAFAAEAEQMGVQLIWPLNAPAWRGGASLLAAYPQLAAASGATTDAGLRNYAIELVSQLPATWGYYIGDELPPSQTAAVNSLSATVRGLDPRHQQLYVGQAFPNLQANLGTFANTANVIGADVYPIGQLVPTSIVGDVARRVVRLAAGADDRAAVVLQAFSWGQYPEELQAPDPRWPTEEEMLAMRNQAASANPSMILWYNLSDILRSDNPAAHWSDLVTAAFRPRSAGAEAVSAGLIRSTNERKSHRHHRARRHVP